MIGKTLGHYQITARVGKGGMGEVFRARDTRLGRDVAIKILPEELASDPDRVARFEREAKAIAALQHPNIVTIHSVETIDGHSCITMELIDGKTLDALIPPGGMPLDTFFEIAIPLSDALRAAHAKGITHRDLKPSNIMVDHEGRLRVLDFGLAKLLAPVESNGETTMAGDGNVTAEGKILGTVNYMSPEQAEAKALDHRSDIFSLGIVLYEMATGIRPFKGDTPISTVSSILKEKPASVTDLRANLPRHLARVINRCLEKNPEKRFQTARDVCNELEGLQKEVESGDVELSSSASMSRSAVFDAPAKKRRAWMPYAIGGAAVAAVAAYFIFLRGPAPEPALDVKTRPITGSVGVEVAGSWSPDGGFIAYSHSQAGPTDIFVVATAGGDPIRLVEGSCDNVSPRWSPDNRWVAFASNRDEKTAIYVVPPLGGQIQKLVDVGIPALSGLLGGCLGANPWSADGRRLLFSRMEADGTMSAWVLEMDTRKESRMTTAAAGCLHYSASYSPDGGKILYANSKGNETTLETIPAVGGEAKEIMRESGFVIPAWAPDGQRVVYGREADGIWMLDSRSGAKRQLLVLENPTGPIVSRDGRILYDRSSHQTDLYVQDVDGGNQQRLTFHTQDNFVAQISSDGSRVAYSSTRTGNAEIWIIDRATGTERQLTNRPSEDWSPCWSPDGREIAFSSNEGGQYRLWVASADGGGLRQVGDNLDAVGEPRWAPDGSVIGVIAQADGGNALFLVDPKDGTSRKVLDHVGSFDWYRDAKHVVYDVEGPVSEMRVVDLDTGETEVLLTTPFAELRVSPDGRSVSFCKALSHSDMNLFILPLALPATQDGLPRAAGEPRPATIGKGEWHLHNGGWSPDSKQVIYTRDTDTGDIYLLEGAM